jgi:hypothetical protein
MQETTLTEAQAFFDQMHRESVANKYLEKDLLADVIGLCKQHSVTWMHLDDSRRNHSAVGWPDLVLAGSHHVIFRELKRDSTSPVSPMQRKWLWTLQATGHSARVWYTADLDSGVIEKEIIELNDPNANVFDSNADFARAMLTEGEDS